MEGITEKAVVLSLAKPEPIAFVNVFEQGDVWVKVKGCAGCERQKACCGRCPMLIDGRDCRLHIEDNGINKPYNCIVKPYPSTKLSFCQQVFKCTAGTNKGKIKRINSNRIE